MIPAYNAADTIGQQLEALICQESAPPFEVVVADNRSTDGTAEVARHFSNRLDIRVVPAFERQGVNCARNAGIQAARGEIVVLLDADDRARPGVLAAFADAFAKEPALGIAGGILSTRDPATYEMEHPQWYLPYLPGCIMAIRREVIDAIGGFDESFVGGHDEVDFCWRAQHAGFPIGLARGALLDRTDRPTPRSAFRQFRRYGATYIQLWVKHRDRGIPGSTVRGELQMLRKTLRRVPDLRSRDLPRRLDAAQAIGWNVGRWQGDLHYRTLGPR
ncbi:glycosyltransferase family A protein [Brachybacterium paraconglomeratum]|uniref:glycosyltransferase n=1 Tax=Brachybacterium sp. GU-2 TaxID=3069708 RepID=UPI00280BFF66|nr:glycosyltransferase family A protein [Brachybacterium sp. GU-2]WME22988.1 glycosyltransferase family A protein [Brachybacterium sp. GU-2]